jgi:hypothetical protein
MNFLSYEAYAFSVFKERYAQGFAFALPKLIAYFVKKLFLLFAQNNSDNVLLCQTSTIQPHNTVYFGILPQILIFAPTTTSLAGENRRSLLVEFRAPAHSLSFVFDIEIIKFIWKRLGGSV